MKCSKCPTNACESSEQLLPLASAESRSRSSAVCFKDLQWPSGRDLAAKYEMRTVAVRKVLEPVVTEIMYQD